MNATNQPIQQPGAVPDFTPKPLWTPPPPAPAPTQWPGYSPTPPPPQPPKG
jgi:hypothetical protein